MMVSTRIWAGVLLAAGLAVGEARAGSTMLVQAESGRAVPDALRVITHTREYCNELANRAAELRGQAAGSNEEAWQLAQEGDRLCLQGQIRPGIIRLRRAIMLLRGQVP